MRPPSLPTLLTALCVSSFCLSTLASAQTGNPSNPTDLRYLDHNLGDGTGLACGRGDFEACFALEFGRCASANPRIAIPTCTRQLVTPENRVFPGNIRYQRAIRYALRANAHAKQGNVDRALSDWDRAVRADRTIFWIHSRRGEAYFLAGDYEEAATVERSLSKRPSGRGLPPSGSVGASGRRVFFMSAREVRPAAVARDVRLHVV